jgi:hypothetical protein
LVDAHLLRFQMSTTFSMLLLLLQLTTSTTTHNIRKEMA